MLFFTYIELINALLFNFNYMIKRIWRDKYVVDNKYYINGEDMEEINLVLNK